MSCRFCLPKPKETLFNSPLNEIYKNYFHFSDCACTCFMEKLQLQSVSLYFHGEIITDHNRRSAQKPRACHQGKRSATNNNTKGLEYDRSQIEKSNP